MEFCEICENMYYLTTKEEDLVYQCKKCGNEKPASSSVVSSISFSKREQYTSIINKYTKLDPTLPRINTILCPNVDCETNTKNKEREIIYIRYDDTNMKYVYLCSSCDTVWKVSEDK